jgi:D-alanine--D-alanine ligase
MANNSTNFGRIAVLMGGPSTEREISLKSGKAVFEVLKKENLNVLALDLDTDNKEAISTLLKGSNIDVAFIALHGRFGEDGCLQRILEELEIPYTGSGIQASRLAMDKVASRKIFKDRGLNVPNSEALNKSGYIDFESLKEKFAAFPLVVKPATHGSSIGVSFVNDTPSLKTAIAFAFQYDNNILVEEYIPGREVTVAVLDEQPLPVVEIIAGNKFFDFEAKYKSNLTQYIVPAQLEEKTKEFVQKAGLAAHRALNCQGFSRADIILDKKDRPFVLEVNTIPGLTSSSLLPKAAAALGIDFTQLCLRMLKLAYEKKQLQKSLEKS